MIGDREFVLIARDYQMSYRVILFGSVTLAWLCSFSTAGLCQDSDSLADDPNQIPLARLDQSAAITHYETHIQPLLNEHCYACHGDGESNGGLELDGFADDTAILADRELWTKVLKNVRSGVMPPSDVPKPTHREIEMLARWIKYGPFGIDPNDVEPGRVTVHRMNRAEYRNTIDQLLGVKFNTTDAFPPDAAGQGLDNIADLLTMSPLLLEKYLDAAESVLEGAFPSENARAIEVLGRDIRGNFNMSGERVSFNGTPKLTFTHRNTHPGSFSVSIELEIVGLTSEEQKVIAEATSAKPDPTGEKKSDPGDKVAARADSDGNDSEKPLTPKMTCHFVASVQSGVGAEEVVLDAVFSSKPCNIDFTIDQLWRVEPHTFNFSVLLPDSDPDQRRQRLLWYSRQKARLPAPHVKIKKITITPRRTEASRQYFAHDDPPTDSRALRDYVQQGVAAFGLRALRRPLDQRTQERLTSEVLATYAKTSRFNDSLKPALIKLLCSPRFLYRVDRPIRGQEADRWALIDEYSLASRLSYFLWSSMPDDELLDQAGKGQLRHHLHAQVKRLLADQRAQNFVVNFSGQWLQTRNVMNWQIVESAVLKREGIEPESNLLTDMVRRAMRDETTMYFSHIVHEDRSVLEFIDSDYSFVNEALADYYEIPGVRGPEMKRVLLPEDSPRGGVLTHGSTLLVTSHSNRTSPTARGLFVLDTFLGIRPHDPPPNVPGIEEAGKSITDREPTFREMLDLHANDAICASCHKLMDPIGFGLDNFNAIGKYRETEFGQPIVASGTLVSGEEFAGINELKQILKTRHREAFYRCFTEKLMTYALGRGLEYFDTETVDQIVQKLEKENGRFSALMMGIIESAPFQNRSNGDSAATVLLSD